MIGNCKLFRVYLECSEHFEQQNEMIWLKISLFLSEDRLESHSNEDGGHAEQLARDKKVSDQD